MPEVEGVVVGAPSIEEAEETEEAVVVSRPEPPQAAEIIIPTVVIIILAGASQEGTPLGGPDTPQTLLQAVVTTITAGGQIVGFVLLH